MSDAIAITGFSKTYGAVRAVKGLTLAVKEGELFGLIGPDGAGKTTTMRTLCTLLPLEQGDMRVSGRDVRRDIPYIRAILGYMPQRFSLYPDLTVQQNLDFFADLFGVSKEEKARKLEQLYRFSKLGPFKKRLAGALSGGMKQKLALSCTLIHTPEILILDEPTTGVDPVSRREFWQILRQLRDEGVSILVSTPYMDEADLCDRVAFMHRGELLALDEPGNLHRHFPHFLYEVSAEATRPLLPFFHAVSDVVSVRIFGDRLHVAFSKKLGAAARQQILQSAPVPIARLAPIRPSVEDTFLALMKNQEASG